MICAIFLEYNWNNCWSNFIKVSLIISKVFIHFYIQSSLEYFERQDKPKNLEKLTFFMFPVRISGPFVSNAIATG